MSQVFIFDLLLAKSFLWVGSSSSKAADNPLYSDDFRAHSSVDDLNKYKAELLILPLAASMYFLDIHYHF